MNRAYSSDSRAEILQLFIQKYMSELMIKDNRMCPCFCNEKVSTNHICIRS